MDIRKKLNRFADFRIKQWCLDSISEKSAMRDLAENIKAEIIEKFEGLEAENKELRKKLTNMVK